THGIQTDTFVDNYKKALGDAQLQRALSNATQRFQLHRNLGVADIAGEWESLRDQARQIKEHTIAHLDAYLDQFTRNVEKAGGYVFWANDAAEANDYVTRLAKERGVKLAVKSKSMMTEEIELNHALEAAGVEAVETDLGEYIIQLAGERPSHIIAPAIHKTRYDVADLFSEKLHVERNAEIEVMTALARRVLRERFASAGLGVSGANFAIAETGTIVLVENEGNIRLTTSLPRTHVAIMGIEKVIPRLDDLSVFLKLLPRSGSGQRFTSYVSFLTGVKRSPVDEGPEQFHVIILDNGRTTMLADPHLRESLYCIRCGACLNVCPVYQKIGGHAYGWIYPGPIGAVITPQLVGRERAAALPFASSLCAACREVCPIKINIPDMLLRLRHQIKEADGARAATGDESRADVRVSKNARFERLVERVAFKVWSLAMMSPRRYERGARLARLAQQVFGTGLQERVASKWTRSRDLLPLAPRSFRDQWVSH
ncbi:MAG TPA: LutB/LldF family L-lactate oxidation iron-sulfur protein, partial [Blastocatellia bacterium]|nr:LutB/LldF family L-lactate oxidation iron-sulfur protein [Blastocatellia bacterium]